MQYLTYYIDNYINKFLPAIWFAITLLLCMILVYYIKNRYLVYTLTYKHFQ
jgi:hypothetical protein